MKSVLFLLSAISPFWISATSSHKYLELSPISLSSLPSISIYEPQLSKPLYLTPYIEKGETDRARELASVTYPGMENVESYSGYLTVNRKYNSNMFFWYVRAESGDLAAPTIIWLQGGYAGSGLFGMFVENGPFVITENGTLIKGRHYTWQKNANIIYVDNPIGSGYSFTDDERGYSRNEEQVGQNLHTAIRQLIYLFPEIGQSDFYISGESYGGKHTVALGHTILHNQHLEPKIHLKGLSLGSGLFDPINILHYGEYLYQHGLLDENGKHIFQQLEHIARNCIMNMDYLCAYDVFQYMFKVNPFDKPSVSLFYNMTGLQYTNYAKLGTYNFTHVDNFVKTWAFREAIHVGNNEFHGLLNSDIVGGYIKGSTMKSVRGWLGELLSHYRVYLYNGEFDVIIAYPFMEKSVQEMKFSGSENYGNIKRKFWNVDDELAGYTKQVGNLTTILVRNAGHMASVEQPKWVFNVIDKMIFNLKF